MFYRLAYFVLMLTAAAGCGREPLPAFANPPPDNTADEDAGPDSEVP